MPRLLAAMLFFFSRRLRHYFTMLFAYADFHMSLLPRLWFSRRHAQYAYDGVFYARRCRHFLPCLIHMLLLHADDA